MSGWISIKDRLPEGEGFVDVIVGKPGGKVFMLMFNTKTAHFQNTDFSVNHYGITHWIPLPEPPTA